MPRDSRDTGNAPVPEFKPVRKGACGNAPFIAPVRHRPEIVIHRLSRNDPRSRSHTEFHRVAVLSIRIDDQIFPAVLLDCLSALGLDHFHRQVQSPVYHVLYGCIRHVVAGHVDIPVVEWFRPMRERSGKACRHYVLAVHHSEKSADSGGLVVRVEPHGTADVQGLFEISAAIQECQYPHGSVQIRSPYGLRHGRFVHVIFFCYGLPGGSPVIRIAVIQGQTVPHCTGIPVIFRQIFQGIFHESPYVGFEKRVRIHDTVDYRRRSGPGIAGDTCSPVGNAGSVFHHTGSGIAPYLVDELWIDLEPVRIYVPVSGKRRGQAIMHETERRPVRKPYPVADMVHPPLAHLLIRRFHAVFLHHGQVNVFDIGIVIGECPVDFLHVPQSPFERERTVRARFHDEVVLILQTVDIPCHLAYPGPGYPVPELVVGNLFLLREAGKADSCQYCR